MFELLLSGLDSSQGGGVEFLGEVPTVGFIDGEELANAIGLTKGTAQHTTEPWLHFVLDGKTLYVAKKPYRHSVSWNSINSAGAVFGTKTVVINGRTYKVRLLKTVASGNIYTGSNTNSGAFDPVGAYGSEWNRLMYPIHSGNHTNVKNPTLVSGEGIHFGTLAQYTDNDLVADIATGNGSVSWCQETPSRDSTARVYRNGSGVSYLYWFSASDTKPTRGWRPVLELIE